MDMALYRHVYLKFWKDDKVMELFSVEEKLLFLFLLTNPNTTQIGVYKILPKEIAFMTGFEEEEVSIMLELFEKEYKLIKYNKLTHEIAIVHWARYNLNKAGGKPMMDCISSELSRVEDVSLLQVILDHIKNEKIKQLYINVINREKEESSKVKDEGEVIYERPSEEQLRRARELYKQV